MVNQAKIYAVTDLAEKIKAAKTTVLIDYQGLTAKQIARLRSQIKESGGLIQVAKNTLITRALAQLGIGLDQILDGPTAIVFANEDEVSPLKIILRAAKELEKPEFKLGIYQKSLLSALEVKNLAGLPNREILLAQTIGSFNNPLFRLIQSLKSNQAKLILILKQIKEKGGENNG